jgi:hypothetical protein
MIQRYTKWHWTHLKNECTCHSSFLSNNCSPYWSKLVPDPIPRCSWGHIPQAASVLVHWWYSCDLSCSLPGPAWVGKPPVSAPSGEPCWASCSRRDDAAVCFRWCRCSRGTLSETLGAMQGSFQTELVSFNKGFIIVCFVCVCLDMSVKVYVDLSSSLWWI